MAASGAAVIVGVGAVFGLLSQSREDEAAAEPVQRRALELHDEANTFAVIANVGFVAGGLLAAAGVAWGIVDLTGGGDEDEASLSMGPAGLSVSGRF